MKLRLKSRILDSPAQTSYDWLSQSYAEAYRKEVYPRKTPYRGRSPGHTHHHNSNFSIQRRRLREQKMWVNGIPPPYHHLPLLNTKFKCNFSSKHLQDYAARLQQVNIDWAPGPVLGSKETKAARPRVLLQPMVSTSAPSHSAPTYYVTLVCSLIIKLTGFQGQTPLCPLTPHS